MSKRDAFSQVQVDVRTGGASHDAATPSDDTPFHVALLGDFSGRGAGGHDRPPAGLRPILVDRDDLDAALARLAPEIGIDVGAGSPLRVRFGSLDDFHPDRLYERLPVFTALREMRRRLADPRAFAAAAAELRADAGAPAAPSTSISPAGATAARLAGGSLLDDIVAASQPPARQASRDPSSREAEPDGDDLASFLRRVVRPHLVPGPDPRQQELLASVDAASAALLRLVLGDPRFRALESLWRGLDMLVRRVETGSRLRLAILDMSRDQLAATLADDPAGAGDLRDGALHRMLADAARALPDGAPWSAIVGLHELGAGHGDIRLMDQLARVGAACGAPWLSAVAPALLSGLDANGTDARSAEWAALRRSPQARWLGLAYPAVLLRLPYGEEGEPCDALPFEELEPGIDPSAARAGMLWGSAALVPALVLAAAFAADGWAMRPSAHLDVERLPLHLHRYGEGVTAIPPTGWLPVESEVLRLLDLGIMPLLARPESDALRLGRLQSVADPATALAGRWAAVTV